MLEETIRAKDFEKANEMIQSGTKLDSGLPDHRITSIYSQLFQHEAYDTILLMVDQGLIETDLYEYDSFGRSIFESLGRYLKPTDQAADFLRAFIPKLDNLNDELEGKTLLSYLLEQSLFPDAIQALIDSGCDPAWLNKAEENLIHQVVKKHVSRYDAGLQYLQILLDAGLDINHPNVVKKTPLHLAVDAHRLPYVEFLLAQGADPFLQDKDGCSAHYISLLKLSLELYELMRPYGPPDFSEVNNQGENMVFLCVSMLSDLTQLRMMLEDGADLYVKSKHYHQDAMPIDLIAGKKPTEFLETAVDLGAVDVGRKDEQGNTILHKVCAHDSNHDEKTAKETYRKVKLLLKAGANAQETNDQEETPIMLASKDNLKAKTVELLLKNN